MRTSRLVPRSRGRARIASRSALALLLVAGAARAGEGAWEPVRDEAGIAVHRRKIDGASLHEFRGRGVVRAPLARVLGVIHDSAHRTEWMHKCVEARSVEEIGDGGQIAYNRTQAPWPLSDRDVVLRGDTFFEQRERRVRLEFHSIDDPRVPPKKGVVRMPFLRGHWILTPTHDGRWTSVEYQVRADPGGALPDWVSNLVSEQLPFRTIANLREQVQRRDYPEFERWVATMPGYRALAAAPSDDRLIVAP